MPPCLPPEVLGIIISWIFDIGTLLVLRQVNKGWCALVDDSASQRLYVDILSKNVERFCGIIKTTDLRSKVRTLVWNIPDRPLDILGHLPVLAAVAETRRQHALSTWLSALERSSEILEMTTRQHGQFAFPKLAHIAIHFRPPPVRGGFICTGDGKANFVRTMFEHVFSGLRGLQGLNELSIHNIPIEMTFPRLTNNTGPMAATGQLLEKVGLESLRMSFLAPEVWVFSQGRKGKPGWYHLPELSLFSISQTLHHLSLSYWGCYMKNTPWRLGSETKLPRLQSLELRSCGFTSTKVLLWILDHADTLRSLKLDDCAIIYSMELCPSSKAEESAIQISREVDGCRVYQIYTGLWEQWFRALVNGLPHLRRFEFGSSRVRAPCEQGPRFKSETSVGPKFGRTNQFLFGLFPDRYLEMKDGTADIPWILRPLGQRRKFKDPPQSDDVDCLALRHLLQVIGQAVEEDVTSSHAAKVRGLMGSVEPF